MNRKFFFKSELSFFLCTIYRFQINCTFFTKIGDFLHA